MIEERNKIIPDEENLIRIEDQVGTVKRLSLRSLGQREVSFYQERLERMRENPLTRIYRKIIKLDKLRGVERC